MANLLELTLLLLVADVFIPSLLTFYHKPLIQISDCLPNIRVQVNDDKLQSAPYLMEAIRQIESQQQHNNNANSSDFSGSGCATGNDSSSNGNYSTILRHDPNTNQIVNLGTLFADSPSSSFNNCHHNSNEGQHQQQQRNNNNHEIINRPTINPVVAIAALSTTNPLQQNRFLSSGVEIAESEPSNVKLASLLGQPELIVAESLPQAARLRNNIGQLQNKDFILSSTSSNNNINISKPPSRALPVTSSHLKRPFGLTIDSDSSSSSTGNQQQSDLQQQSAYKQQQNSLVSPSVVSDESLVPHTVVRMSDLMAASGDEIDKRLDGHHQNYHELDQASVEAWRNSDNANETSQQAPRVIYPKAPNRSYTHSGRARITVGAGNQLASSGSSTLSLESSRSTDLSPTVYDNRQQDLDLGNNSNQLNGNEGPINDQHAQSAGGHRQEDMPSETTLNDANTVIELQPVESNASNTNQQSSFQRHRQNQLIVSSNGDDAFKTLEPTNLSQAENANNKPAQIIHSSATTGTIQLHNQQQHQQQHQTDQPVRVIEIPERIVVTADLSKNNDPIEIMPSPPEPHPIRLVVNRTRVGRPDARCPKEGVTTFEHPSACDKYFYCEDGYLIEQTCPNGLMYGTMYRVKDYCVYRWHADCVDKVIPNPISSPGCRWQYGVFSVQGSPKCTPDYYECIAGRFEVKKCSITGQVYDDRTKGCQYAEKVGCPEEIISDFQCPVDDRTNSFWPFPRYYLDTKTIIHCVNDKPRIMRCPEGERVDLEHLYCIPMGAKEPVVMDRKVRERQKGTMQPQKNVN